MGDVYGLLPIHHAAAMAPLPVLQIIAEVNNMANLTGMVMARPGRPPVQLNNIENLRYIHSLQAELLLVKDTTIHHRSITTTVTAACYLWM